MAKFCSNCGTQLDESKKFCTACGEKQETAEPQQQQLQESAPQPLPLPPQPEPVVEPVQNIPEVCSNCGDRLEDGAKFCMNCGAKHDSAAQPPQQQMIQPVVQQSQNIQPQPPQQYQTQPQPPPYVPADVSKPKKKSKLPIILIIIGVVVIGIGVGAFFLVTSVFGILDKTAKEDYYTLGSDKIPSVKLALGEERKITNTSTSISGDTTKKEITYKVSGTEQSREMSEYYTYLHDKDGFLNLTDINFDGQNGTAVVGRNSVDNGYEIQIQIKYDLNGYTINILKQPGSIEAINQNTADEPVTDGPDDPNGTVSNDGAWIGVWRRVGDYDINVYSFKADGTFKADFYFSDGTLITSMEGKYVMSGNEIIMTEVRYLGSFDAENFTYGFNISGDLMWIDGSEYDRIPAQNANAVLADPLFGLAVNDGPSDTMQNSPAYYELGRDSVTSITQIVGDRRLYSYDTGTADSVATVTAVYLTDTGDETQAANDIWDYFQHLSNNEGFISLVSFDGLPYEGGIELSLAKNSVSKGEIIILYINYDSTGYALEFSKGEGTLTLFDEEEEATSSPVTPVDPDRPSNNGETGSLTAGIFNIMKSGTYHMIMKSEYAEIDIYAKNGMMAELMNMEEIDYRIVIRDGKYYTIMDEYEMVMVAEASPDDSYVPGASEASNLIYIGEGSGEFNGKVYKYDEYADEIDGDYFYYYFVDGGDLKGIRTVMYGVPSDIEILAFDKNVPDSVFDIPANYYIIE